jgi:hypothetical protein
MFHQSSSLIQRDDQNFIDWRNMCICHNKVVVVHAQKRACQCTDIRQQSELLILWVKEEHKSPWVLLIGCSKMNS